MIDNEAKLCYCSKEQRSEIESIRKKYLSQKEDKMQRLRRLDSCVTKKVTMYSLIIGIIGALILGVGMCCCMVWDNIFFIPGIIIGIAGIFIVSVTYPIYNRILSKEREKIAPEVIRLTDELMKENV